ncbi:putative nuclease HARBI1 isoform X2 [Tanacetum coccineum]
MKKDMSAYGKAFDSSPRFPAHIFRRRFPIRQLAYGVAVDALDEYIHIGETTAIEYGIYPEWATMVKSFSHPDDPKKCKFKEKQEAARKDVERAFGVLQSRWAIVRGPARSWQIKNIKDIMYACIILHNMIVEDERNSISDWSDDVDPLIRVHRGAT